MAANPTFTYMTPPPSSCVIRPVVPDDVSTIFTLIQALADYENLSHEVVGNESALYEHLFGDRPYIESLLIEENGIPAGFALFFKTYSTPIGTPGYYLEDLFVFPDYRGRGLGKALLSALAQRTSSQNFQHLQWSVLDWNAPAIAFYQSIGADISNYQRIARLTGDALIQLAHMPQISPRDGLSQDGLPQDGLTVELVDASFWNTYGPESLCRVMDDAILPFDAQSERSTKIEPMVSAFNTQPSIVEVLAIHRDAELLGLATFTYSYSTFLTQPGLLLETLSIAPSDRLLEIQHIVLHTLAKLAVDRACGRLEWLVDHQNAQTTAQCQRLGGMVLPDWRICRMNAEAIANLASAE